MTNVSDSKAPPSRLDWGRMKPGGGGIHAAEKREQKCVHSCVEMSLYIKNGKIEGRKKKHKGSKDEATDAIIYHSEVGRERHRNVTGSIRATTLYQSRSHTVWQTIPSIHLPASIYSRVQIDIFPMVHVAVVANNLPSFIFFLAIFAAALLT